MRLSYICSGELSEPCELSKLSELSDPSGIMFTKNILGRVSINTRVVSTFLSRRLHAKSRWLFPFYFSNITLRTDLLTFRVTGTVK